ncbi:NAD(P)-binding protein [Rhodovastum atsumiense]|nr:pyridine nucleotide-disulfide oxidoreductase/dicluster-binding protein [Rhodovastum atsumiense]CAH2603844.1 NAD(P)-binding protein [Rhodovastum atsumiense]
MDGERVRAWEARCVEEQPPACVLSCPLRVDARSMMEKMAQGAFAEALAIYARVVPFPAILSRICDRPCETSCRRGEAGGAVQIRALEQACVTGYYGTLRRTPQKSRKPRRIAVIGAGLAGLTAAFDLAMKGNAVEVFEAAAEPLPRLRQEHGATLPPSVVVTELDMLARIGVALHCDTRITGGDSPLGLSRLIDTHDAVVLATGAAAAGWAGLGDLPGLDLAPDGAPAIDPLTHATSHPKLFSGGTHAAGTSAIVSMRDGRRAAVSIDRLLQGASLTANRTDGSSGPSCLYTNVAAHAPVAPVVPSDPGQGYDTTEAIREAARCFPCRCQECVRACAFLAHYKTYPKRTVREIYNNDCIVMGTRKSNRMVNSCTLCGLCATVCPNDLPVGEVCLEARQSMVEKGRMPASHHEFALRDMAYSRSGLVAFHRHQPGHDSSAAVFFPGCQLVASAPEHVARVYRHLAGTLPGGVGLMIECCGAPAHWAGRRDLHAEVLAGLRTHWEALGRPRIITACSTCLGMFQDFAPEMAPEPVWTVLARIGWPADAAQAPGRHLAIHDPCTARSAAGMQQAVRDLAAGLGVVLQELGGADHTTCCGYGGLVSFANPEVANKIVDQRAGASEADYLVYCAMCRDNFARRGKRAVHLLDLAFPPADGTDPAGRPDPGFSRRRDNRARFRTTMLRDVWGETMSDPVPDLPLTIADDVRADMERRLILVEDVAETIAHAERGGRKLRDPASGRLVATHRIGNVTIWVEYAVAPAGIVVHRAYSHRMVVEAKP